MAMKDAKEGMQKLLPGFVSFFGEADIETVPSVTLTTTGC